jgi:type II secretory pathway pseudopilin PulG
MNQNSNKSRQLGFTIVELMIAMAFIALLLLAIAAAVIQIGAIYNKGVTMKSVNQAGRLIVSDIKRVVGESEPFSVATAYKPHDRSQGSTDTPEYDGGRLCTGQYSYIWNIGKYINPDVPASQANKYAGADSDKPIRLIRVRDNGMEYCKIDAAGAIQLSGATELLSDGTLAVQDFQIDRVTNNMASGVALYSIKIEISDASQDAIETNIDTLDTTCKTPSSGLRYQSYCAVNEFVFTARAGNKGGQ